MNIVSFHLKSPPAGFESCFMCKVVIKQQQRLVFGANTGRQMHMNTYRHKCRHIRP